MVVILVMLIYIFIFISNLLWYLCRCNTNISDFICVVMPKVATTSTILCRHVEHLSPTSAAQQRVTRFISVAIMNLVAPKAGAKRELLFKLAFGGSVEHLSPT